MQTIEDFIKLAKYNTSFAEQLALIRNDFTNATNIAYGGGQFQITEQRMLFNQLELSKNNTSTVLIDDNGTPIRIDDLVKFSDMMYSTWVTETNAFLNNYTKLRGARSVTAITNIYS